MRKSYFYMLNAIVSLIVVAGLLSGGTTTIDKEQWLLSKNQIISTPIENNLSFKADNEAKGDVQHRKQSNLKASKYGKRIKTKYRNNTYPNSDSSKLANKHSSLYDQKHFLYSFLKSYHSTNHILTSLKTVVLLH